MANEIGLEGTEIYCPSVEIARFQRLQGSSCPSLGERIGTENRVLIRFLVFIGTTVTIP